MDDSNDMIYIESPDGSMLWRGSRSELLARAAVTVVDGVVLYNLAIQTGESHSRRGGMDTHGFVYDATYRIRQDGLDQLECPYIHSYVSQELDSYEEGGFTYVILHLFASSIPVQIIDTIDDVKQDIGSTLFWPFHEIVRANNPAYMITGIMDNPTTVSNALSVAVRQVENREFPQNERNLLSAGCAELIHRYTNVLNLDPAYNIQELIVTMLTYLSGVVAARSKSLPLLQIVDKCSVM